MNWPLVRGPWSDCPLVRDASLTRFGLSDNGPRASIRGLRDLRVSRGTSCPPDYGRLDNGHRALTTTRPSSLRLGLMLPAPMEPEILGGILADEPFEGAGEALGEDADVVGGAGRAR